MEIVVNFFVGGGGVQIPKINVQSKYGWQDIMLGHFSQVYS
jgi:hypothetical protein